MKTVEKLRRTIDAMCYPRGGCNHYNNAVNTLELKRKKLINILQMNAPNNNNINNNNINNDNSAVNDLGKVWEELQTVKKVIQKLYLEKQHLETTLNHALSIIQNKNNNINENEIEENINKVLKSIETQGNIWTNNINKMDNKLKQFELKVLQLKNNKNNENIEYKNDNNMNEILDELENNITYKKQELENINKQLNKERIFTPIKRTI